MTGALLVRADAGPAMGLGHVLRTLALAQAWQDRGGTVAYATIALPDRVRARLEREGVEVLGADCAPGSPADVAWTRALAERRGARVVVDGYPLGVPFANALVDAGLRVLLVDDEGTEAPIRAMVLNQNLHGRRPLYPRAAGTVLAGIGYAMLRRELLRVPRPPIAACARTALVTFGGADPAGLTETAARALVDAGVERVVAVVGPAASARDFACPGVEVHVDPPEFFALAASADVAVAAAGSTVWELAWLGVPMALVSTAPNQEPTLAAVVGAGLAIGLGDAAAFRASSPVATLAALLGDAALREALARRGRALVDGGGAGRVAEALAR